jgi:general nucleoside transport system permease protein
VLAGRVSVVRRVGGGAHAGAYRIVALVVGLAIGALIAQTYVIKQGDVYHTIYQATFGTPYGATAVMSYAGPLTLTALAFAVGYKVRLWNLGGEGQLFMGAWAASGVAFTFPGIPGPLLIALMIVASAIGGALWVLVPALARIYLGVTEVVTTLMLNFVAILWMTYFALNVWPPTPRNPLIASKDLPARTDLPPLTVGQVTVEAGLIVAVCMAVVLAVAFRKTRFGFSVRVTGASPRAAEYAAIPIKRLQLRIFLLSGALAGLAGGLELVGSVHALSDELSTNTGYNGIGVAVLAGSVFAMVPVMALVFGGLLASGNALSIDGLSTDATLFLTGFVLLLAAVGESASRFRVIFAPLRGGPRVGATPDVGGADPVPGAAARGPT